MKKLLLTLVLAIAPLSPSLADNDIGCGFGTILWEGQSGVFAKTFAATTNASLGSQTFGISSGTLECQQGGVITAAARIPMYASGNLDQLAADMAAGKGEALSNLAELYGIAAPDRAAFYKLAQTNFPTLFPAGSTTADEMLAALESIMAGDSRLQSYTS